MHGHAIIPGPYLSVHPVMPLAGEDLHSRVVVVVIELDPIDEHFGGYAPANGGAHIAYQHSAPEVLSDEHLRVEEVVGGPALDDHLLVKRVEGT